MTHVLKKITLALGLLSITLFSFAYGDYNSSYSQNDDCCQPTCCFDGFVSVDLLYWRAFQSGLESCVPSSLSDTVNSEGFVLSEFSGRGRNPNFKWNPGFRIAAGVGLPCSNWDIVTSWTHFHSKSDGSHGGSSRWKIDFDVIDALAVYEAKINSCFALKPFFGLRGARIHDNMHISDIDMDISDIDSTLTTIDSRSIRRNKQTFTGIGPIIGLGADWGIGCGFSLYTTVSVSQLYGRFNVHLFESQEFIDSLSICTQKNRLDASVSVADMGLGVRFETCICEKQVMMQLGLEQHRYFNYSRVGCYGDLSFDGINLSTGIKF